MIAPLHRVLWLSALLSTTVCLFFPLPLQADGTPSKPQSGVRSKILAELGIQPGFTETFDSLNSIPDPNAGILTINNIKYQIKGYYDTGLCDHCAFCVLKDDKCVETLVYNGKGLETAEGDRALSVADLYKVRGRIVTGIGVSVMDAGGMVPRTISVTTKTVDSGTKYDFPVKHYPPQNLGSSLDAGTYAFIPQPLFLDSINVLCQGMGSCIFSTIDYFYDSLGAQDARNQAIQLAKEMNWSVTSRTFKGGGPVYGTTFPSGFTSLGVSIACQHLAQYPSEGVWLALSNSNNSVRHENLREYYDDDEFAETVYGWFGYPTEYRSMTLQTPAGAGCELKVVDAFNKTDKGFTAH